MSVLTWSAFRYHASTNFIKLIRKFSSFSNSLKQSRKLRNYIPPRGADF